MKDKLLKINQSKLSLILFILIITASILNILIFIISYIHSQNNLSQDNQFSKNLVPYVNQNIPADTVITKDMISYITVPKRYLIGNYITNIDEIIGKCTTYRYSIPQGSLIYQESIDDCNKTRLDSIDTLFYFFRIDVEDIIQYRITDDERQIYINSFKFDYKKAEYIKENLHRYDFSKKLKNSMINMLNQIEKTYQQLNVDDNLNYNKDQLKSEYQKLETYYYEYEKIYSEEYK